MNCDIDDDIIELHAVGRLQDYALRQHLDTCGDCRSRVSEYRSMINELRQALESFERKKEEKRHKNGNGDPKFTV